MAQEKSITNTSSSELTKSVVKVNGFNENFFCSEVNNILPLYEQINNVWQHPLILNYNYCLICKETINSPYSIYSLQQTHLQVNSIRFIKSLHIKFRLIPTKLRNIRRRMIKSSDHKLINLNTDKKFYSKYEDISSDTDILFVSANKKTKKKKGYSFNKRHTDFNMIKTNNFNINNKVKDKVEHSDKAKMTSIEEKEIIQFNRQISEKNNPSTFIPMNIEEKEILGIVNRRQGRFSTKNKENGTQAKSIMKIFKMITGNNEDKQSQSTNKTPRLHNNNNAYKSTSDELNTKQYLDTHTQECCNICLEEIKDKFVLGCGDFYCRKCIRGVVINSIYNISQFNKLVCPREICKSKMEERVIEKLLTNEEFAYYSKIKTRVEGLRNKSLIPCPYPDCEQWGKEKEIKKGLLYCGNNHFFCVKCLKIILQSPTEESSVKEHICSKKKDDTSKYLTINKFIKKCPNCSTWVQREPGGCNNMTCTNPWCNTEFCWICERTYDAAHYKNPFSICFGLGESDYKSNLSKYKSIRVLKCIVIFLLLLFIVLPIVVNLFSLVLVSLYLVSFVFDGSTMKNIKIKNDLCRTIFNIYVYLLYFCLSTALIPFGYIILGLFIVGLPILIVVNKIRKLKEEDDYY